MNCPTPLPTSPEHPEHLKTELCAAFDVQGLYRQHIKQATIWAATQAQQR